MKTCDEIRPQLGAYVLGGLEPEEEREVREHLAHCPDCAREYAELAVAGARELLLHPMYGYLEQLEALATVAALVRDD